MRKIAVILYGPPGSGKGTQANLVAGHLEAIHFDTGRFLEATVHDPARRKEKFIVKERKLFDGGKLLTPSFVTKEVSKKIKEIAGAGWGLVFSGSPRTMYEAERVTPVLEKLYGKKNIFVFVLRVGARISLRRNSARVVCSVCGAPLLTAYYPSRSPKHCPVCGGSFYRRTLDNRKTIRVRLKEYENRTRPIFTFMKKRGYRVVSIDGAPAPYIVFRRIYGFLKKPRRN